MVGLTDSSSFRDLIYKDFRAGVYSNAGECFGFITTLYKCFFPPLHTPRFIFSSDLILLKTGFEEEDQDKNTNLRQSRTFFVLDSVNDLYFFTHYWINGHVHNFISTKLNSIAFITFFDSRGKYIIVL